jgi:hypothetical protein
MSMVVGLAALILWIRDRWSLPKDASEDEKQAIIGRRSALWVRGWVLAQGLMAAVSVPLNVLGLITKSIPMRVIYIGLGCLYLLAYWAALRTKGEDLPDAEDHQNPA